MKTNTASVFLAAALLSGCVSDSPYDHIDNWLIREDPVRAFAIPADVIYIQNDLYVNMAHVPLMHTYAEDEVGKGRFSGVARVFSPLVANGEDVELALKWYFRYHHAKNRLFAFIGEGEGGRLLREYEESRAEDLKKMGLVASFYTDDARKGFVTPEMVRTIRDAVVRERYRRTWGRDMPDGMLAK